MNNSWRNSDLDLKDLNSYHAFVSRAGTYLLDFHRTFCRLARNSADPELPEYAQRRSLALTAIDHLAPIFVDFITQVVLQNPDPGMNNFGKKLNFRGRFGPREGPELLVKLEAGFEYLLVAGFGLHYLLTDFPTRAKIVCIEPIDVQREWMTKVIIAGRSLRAYDREQHGLPGTFATLVYEASLGDFTKEHLRLGFWKQAQAESYGKNVFWAGVLLAVVADVQSRTVPPATRMT